MSEWVEAAEKRLDDESKNGKFDKYGNAMKGAVKDALKEFARQDDEFAQAIAQGGSFTDCMAAVAKRIKNGSSDGTIICAQSASPARALSSAACEHSSSAPSAESVTASAM